MNALNASPRIPYSVADNAIKDFMEDHGRMQDEKLASFLFIVVGVGYLFPFSALTQPVDYWHELFPDFNIEFALTTVYMWTNLTMLALLVFCSEHSNSFTPRIVGGFIGQLMVLAFVPTSYFFGLTESFNMCLVLASTAIAAIVTAFLDSSVISLASQYPLRVQESFQLGVGVSTLIGSLYRDITKLVFPPESVVMSSLVYFYSGAATLVGCIGAYFLLLSLPISKKCLSAHTSTHQNTELTLLVEPQVESLQQTTVPIDRFQVLRKILKNELLVCLLFSSTLALWPPLITEIKSYNFPYLQRSQWWPLILLTTFSLLDCLGRFAVRFRGCLTKDNIWIPVLGRFGFFPLIICSVKGIFFTHDFWSVLFVSGLGFTNGYIGTLTIVMVNECISPQEHAIAGSFTSFFLNSGLVLGATAGLVMEKLVST